MSKIKNLIDSYSTFISIPWREDASANQRTIFCIYDPSDELRLRAKIDEFRIATQNSDHRWICFDLSNTFAHWLCRQRYAKSYFQKPHLLVQLIHKYFDYVIEELERFLVEKNADSNCVVALIGVGTLFEFISVSGLADKLAPIVSGRLLVFFPGSYENSNYRLLDAYDGWNYLAVPITGNEKY